MSLSEASSSEEEEGGNGAKVGVVLVRRTSGKYDLIEVYTFHYENHIKDVCRCWVRDSCMNNNSKFCAFQWDSIREQSLANTQFHCANIPNEQL